MLSRILCRTLSRVRPLWWILLLALLLRCSLIPIIWFYPQRAYTPDSASYLAFAQAILRGQGWTFPEFKRTPAYPLLLTLGLVLFGDHTVGLVMLQVVLATLSVLLTYLIARYFFDETTALAGALLLSINTESITHSIYLLTETFYTFLLLSSSFFLLMSIKARKALPVLLSGFLLGVAILTRPIALYYPVIVVVFILLFFAKNLKAGFLHGLIFVLACVTPIIPWVVRNQRLMGLATVSTISSYNLYFYNALSFDASRRDVSEAILIDEYKLRLEKALTLKELEDTEANRARLASQLGKEIILSDPLRYALNHLKYDLNSLLPDTDLLEILGFSVGQNGTLTVLKHQGLIPAIHHYFGAASWMLLLLLPHIILLGITYLGCGLAVYLLLRRRRYLALIWLAMPVLYGLLLPGAPANPRFRVPVMPFICILAAVGLLFVARKWLQWGPATASKNAGSGQVEVKEAGY